MSDGRDEPPSTREYLSRIFLNRISLAGVALALVGLALLVVWPTRRGATVGTVVALTGVVIFVVGFTLAQRRLSRETRWGH